MSDFYCPICELNTPHDHSILISPAGSCVDAILHHVADPNAEVRDSETGELIFPARKAPFRLIDGGMTDKDTKHGK